MQSRIVGILPAAGRGTRLGLPYAKELLPITADDVIVTVLESNLKQLAAAHIEEAIIVIRHEKEMIRQYLGLERYGVHLRYAYQHRQKSREGLPDGIAAAYSEADRYDLCVMLMPDVHLSSPLNVSWLVQIMEAHKDVIAGVSLWDTTEPSRFGVVELDGIWVKSVLDKPKGLRGTQKFWGITAFRRPFWTYIFDEVETLSNALHRAAQDEGVITAPTAGQYRDLGTPMSLIQGIVEVNR